MVDAQGFLTPEFGNKPPVTEAPEQRVEQGERDAPSAPQEQPRETVGSEKAQVAERPKIASFSQPVVQKDPELLEVEELLSHNMTDVFLALPADRKRAFKESGEEAARKIQALVATGRATARKIFDIVRDWLRGLPMINRFFLEQEAKIKTDEIVAYIERKNGHLT